MSQKTNGIDGFKDLQSCVDDNGRLPSSGDFQLAVMRAINQTDLLGPHTLYLSL